MARACTAASVISQQPLRSILVRLGHELARACAAASVMVERHFRRVVWWFFATRHDLDTRDAISWGENATSARRHWWLLMTCS